MWSKLLNCGEHIICRLSLFEGHAKLTHARCIDDQTTVWKLKEVAGGCGVLPFAGWFTCCIYLPDVGVGKRIQQWTFPNTRWSDENIRAIRLKYFFAQLFDAKARMGADEIYRTITLQLQHLISVVIVIGYKISFVKDNDGLNATRYELYEIPIQSHDIEVPVKPLDDEGKIDISGQYLFLCFGTRTFSWKFICSWQYFDDVA